MKDFTGKELFVGDKVITIIPYSRKLSYGIIRQVWNKQAEVEYQFIYTRLDGTVIDKMYKTRRNSEHIIKMEFLPEELFKI